MMSSSSFFRLCSKFDTVPGIAFGAADTGGCTGITGAAATGALNTAQGSEGEGALCATVAGAAGTEDSKNEKSAVAQGSASTVEVCAGAA